MNSKNESELELERCKMQIARLKDENEELVRNLYKINVKLHDSERLKGHFISNVTNEIVNPFASVLALTEAIIQLPEGEMVQAHRLAELIYEEAFHLDFQLKNIFVAASIEAGKEEPKLSVIRINDLSQQIVQYFQTQLKKKNIQLSVRFVNQIIPGAAILITSDKEKMDMILKNLLSNSIKYSPEDSVIELDFIFEKGIFSMVVSDHGKGIDRVDRNVIFDRFKQLDEKINSINTGQGLGLSIVQAYAGMLGGNVTLNDNPDGGIRVIVSIPENAGTDDWDDLEDFLLDNESSF